MKKLILAMCICSLCLAFMTGCGNKEADSSPADIVETIDNERPDENPEETKALSGAEDESVSPEMKDTEKFADLANEEVPKAEIDTSKFTDELCGDVRSINTAEKFVVVSKIDTEEDGNAEIAVVPVEGSSDEELIFVYFTDEAKYVLETGKADGTNVNRTEVSFSEIAEKDMLNLKGLENTVGTEFLATEVEIIRVID